jgi:hypothetical protein
MHFFKLVIGRWVIGDGERGERRRQGEISSNY